MTRSQFQENIGWINSWLLVLLAFFLPLSTSVASVSALLFLAGWLCEGDFRKKYTEITGNPMARVVLVYIAALFLGLLWNDAIGASASGIQKQWKMLLMPFFLTAVRPEQRWRVLWAFIAGMGVMMLCTYLAWMGFIQHAGVPSGQLTKKSFHVVYNPMLAITIYLLIYQLVWGKLQGWVRLALTLLTGLMVINMFMTEGRTGQLVFFVLVGVLLFQYLQTTPWKAVLALLLAPPLIFFASYHLSHKFQERVDLAKNEVQIYKHNPKTSVGQRLFFWEHSWQIFKESPVLGVGTGGFEPAYAERNNRLSPHMPVTDNPHNQYVLAAVQLGLLGLGTLLALFMTQLWLAWKSTDDWGKLRLAFPIFFLVVMWTESYLLIHETGILFSLFCAVLYKQAPSTGAVVSAQAKQDEPAALPG
ncbi:MAG: O-antigen ligase family protein [Desulfobulbaceae bacterium]|nr:O-antigen ligase family protein [Desulfobulbaceae bacterium]